MDPLRNVFPIGKTGVFRIGDTEVRLIPESSIFNLINSDAIQENKPKIPQKKEKFYRCTKCSYTTAWSGSFKRHFMCRHTDVKPYSCSECGYRTADIGNLKKHVTARHTLERAFQCLLCPYGTINLSHLRRHVANQHIGERPHACPTCPYAAGQMSDLKKHVLAKHPALQIGDWLHCDDKELPEEYHYSDNVLPSEPKLENSLSIVEREYGCFHCNFSSKLFRKLKVHILGKHFPLKPPNVSTTQFVLSKEQ